jgi:isoleucyl-tRNA synthetase
VAIRIRASPTTGSPGRLSVNARALGPRLGKDVQRVIQAAKAGDWRLDILDDGDAVIVDGTTLERNEYELELEAADPASAIAFLPAAASSCSTPTSTPELEAEGLARDVVRAVQQARKDAGLDVGDRITLTMTADAAAVSAIETHRELIAGRPLPRRSRPRGWDGTVPVGADSRISIGVERA